MARASGTMLVAMNIQEIAWKLRGPALRAALSTLPLAWLIFQQTQGHWFFWFIWIVFIGMALGGVLGFTLVLIAEVTRKPPNT